MAADVTALRSSADTANLEGQADAIIAELEAVTKSEVVVVTRKHVRTPEDAVAEVDPSVVAEKERADAEAARAASQAIIAAQHAEAEAPVIGRTPDLFIKPVPSPGIEDLLRSEAAIEAEQAEKKANEAVEAKVETDAKVAREVIASKPDVAEAVILIDPTPDELAKVEARMAAAEAMERYKIATEDLSAARQKLREANESLNTALATAQETLDMSEQKVLDNATRDALQATMNVELTGVDIPTVTTPPSVSTLNAERVAVDAATATVTEHIETLASATDAVDRAVAAWEAEQARLAEEAERARQEAEAAAAAELAKQRAQYVNGYLPDSDLASPGEFAPEARVRADAAQALGQLNAAYRDRFGRDLTITSSYRTFEDQVRVKASRGWWAATPGWSNHGWGLAVDLGNLGGFGSETYRWLTDNAPDFGWHNPPVHRADGYKPEPWHWEYFAGM